MTREESLALVNEVKTQYEKLKEKAAMLSTTHGEDPLLPLSEISIDKYTATSLDDEVSDAVDFTKRRLARSIERSMLSVDKLKSHFIDTFVYHHHAVSTFSGNGKVATIPTEALSEETIADLANMQTQKDPNHNFGPSRQTSVAYRPAQTFISSNRSSSKDIVATQPEKPSAEQLRKERMHARQKRAQEIIEFEATRPSGAENPNDAAEFQAAAKSVGSLVLKSSPDYRVPDEERKNAARKRRQICLVYAGILEFGKEFCEKVVALKLERDRIAQIVSSFISASPDKIAVSSFIQKHFANKKDTFQLIEELRTIDVWDPLVVTPQEVDLFIASGKSSKLPILADLLPLDQLPHPNDISQLIGKFDADVIALSKERVEVEFSIKSAKWNLCKLQEELRVLESYEAKDAELLSRAEQIACDAASYNDKLTDCDVDLQAQKAAVQKWQMKQDQLQSELSTLLEQYPIYSPALNDIFKKSRVPLDSDSAAGSVHGDGHDDDEEEEEPDVCPPGCDIVVYESVLNYRKRKFLLNNELKGIQESITRITADHTRLLKLEKEASTELRMLRNQIEDFQNDKQKILNKIDSLIITDPSKLLNRNADGSLPLNLDDSVLIPEETISRLIGRIDELTAEKLNCQDDYKAIEHDYQRKLREKKIAKDALNALKKELEELSILKFGQKVELDKLEAADISSDHVLAAKARLQSVQTAIKEKLNDLDISIKHAQVQLDRVTVENTAMAKALVKAGRTMVANELLMASKISKTVVDDDTPQQQELKDEREKLMKIAKEQQLQIRAVADEIDKFGRKGASFWATLNEQN